MANNKQNKSLNKRNKGGNKQNKSQNKRNKGGNKQNKSQNKNRFLGGNNQNAEVPTVPDSASVAPVSAMAGGKKRRMSRRNRTMKKSKFW